MAVDYTTTALLASIKRRSMLPTNDATLSDADLRAIATEELQTYVVEVLQSASEELFVNDHDTVLTAGTASYQVPERAVGSSLRDVLLSSDGGTNFWPLRRITPEAMAEYLGPTPGSDVPTAFVLADTSVILLPTPNAANTLRLKYFRRPGALVATTAVATIQSIDVPRTTITTTATIPATITDSSVLVDIVSAKPGFRSPAIDLVTTTGTTGSTIVLTTALPASVVAGDYVALAGESPVPQIPVEAHPLLAVRTAVKCLEALGDPKAMAMEQLSEKMRERLLAQVTPRTPGSPQYLISRSGPGLSRWGWRRGY